MLQKYLDTLTDRRVQGRIKHKMLEVIIMTVCAVVSGCDCWWQIADFCKVKEQWFRDRLGLELKNGVASHDTFERIFDLLDPKEFERNFVAWVKSVCDLDKEIVNIDGKTIKGSRNQEHPPLHLVSAWANQNRMVLCQSAIYEKSNEITAIPNLLDVMDLRGCIITLDAMGTQREIASKIAQNNDYVLALKNNQKRMYKDVYIYFEEALQDERLYFAENVVKTSEKSHGRIEKRAYYLSTDIDWLEQRQDWAGLKAIGAVWTQTLRNGKWITEHRYYLTTLTDIQLFAKSVRGHWCIENSLHWCLDVTFKEDACIVRTGNTVENFAIIRKIALNLLTKYQPPHTKEKLSIKAKRNKCQYDCEFMADVLLSSLQNFNA